MLQRLGIAEAVKAKTVLWKGGYAAEALVNGQAELCVHQISEILPVKGVVLVGPLPAEVNKVTVYAGAMLASKVRGGGAGLSVGATSLADGGGHYERPGASGR